MTEGWTLNIPFTSPEDTPVDMLNATRALPEDEARISRQIVIGAFTDGWGTSAGELLDHIEKATPSERRELLDRARLRAGLKTTERIEFEQRHAQDQRNAQARAVSAPAPIFALNESGLIVDLAEQEQEAERIRLREETLRRRREDERAERQVEAEQMHEHDRAVRERFRRESPPGMAA